MKETKGVSVWPVAFSGGVKIEGPLCKDGVIDKWHSGWGSERYNYRARWRGRVIRML